MIKSFLIFSLIVVASIVEGSSDFRNEGSLNVSHLLTPNTKPRAFESTISSMVECVRTKIKNGIPSIGIKSLDPLKLPILPLILNNDIITSSMLLTGFRLEGLAGFELKEGTVTIPLIPIKGTLDLNLNFNKIKVTTNYKGSMKLFGLINLYGKGSVTMDFDNTNFDLSGTVNVFPLQVSKLNINVILPTTKVTVTGLFNDEFLSKIISRQMTDTLTTLAYEENARFNTLINTVASSAVTTIINPMLSNLTLSDIMDIISSGNGMGCEPITVYAVNWLKNYIADHLHLDVDNVDL